MTDVHASVDQLARLLELVGVAIIIGGIVVAAVLFAYSGLTTRDWRPAYEECRSNLGRGILLGLELLVGADIISTITAPLTTAEALSSSRDRSLARLRALFVADGSWRSALKLSKASEFHAGSTSPIQRRSSGSSTGKPGPLMRRLPS